MGDAPAVRRSFVRSQVEALAPFDYVVFATTSDPFDGLEVSRSEDGSFDLVVVRREDAPPFEGEEVVSLASIGFDGSGHAWSATGLVDVSEVAGSVDQVLEEVFDLGSSDPVNVRHGSRRDEVAAERKVAEMRATIEPVLAGLLGAPPPQDDDGDYIVDLGSSRVFVAPRALPKAPPIIRVFAITNGDVPLVPELGLFLARVNFSLMFGRFSVDADHQAVWFDETLLGEHVTDEELRFTVEMVAVTAAEWDKRIAKAFGGTVREPRQERTASPSNKPGQGGYL